MVETLVRLKGELTSAGFETEIVDGAAAGGRGRRLARPPRTAGGAARGRRGGRHRRRSLARLRRGLGDRQGDGQVGRAPRAVRTGVRARVEDAGDPGHRASALELSRDRSGGARSAERAGAAPPPPPAVVHFVEMEQLARHPERFGVEVGGAAVMSLDGVGPALLPLVRFDWSLRPWLLAAGGAGRPRHAPDRRERRGQRAGRASVRAARRQRPLPRRTRGCVPSRRCPPACCARRSRGAPTPRTRAASSSNGRSSSTRASGAQLRLPDRFYLSLAAHAQLAEPYLAVRFVDTVVATSARPNLLLTLTIGAWL